MDGAKITVGEGNTRVEMRCEHQAGLLYVVHEAVMNWVCSQELKPAHSLAGFFRELQELDDHRMHALMQRWGLYFRVLPLEPAEKDRDIPSLTPGSRTTTSEGPAELEVGTLSARELQCLSLAGQGYSNKRIAMRLEIQESTVKTHMGRVLSKLQANDRAHAVVRAIEEGWLTVELTSPIGRQDG